MNREDVLRYLASTPPPKRRSPEEIERAWKRVLLKPPDPEDSEFATLLYRADAFTRLWWIRHDVDEMTFG